MSEHSSQCPLLGDWSKKKCVINPSYPSRYPNSMEEAKTQNYIRRLLPSDIYFKIHSQKNQNLNKHSYFICTFDQSWFLTDLYNMTWELYSYGTKCTNTILLRIQIINKLILKSKDSLKLVQVAMNFTD